jgi:hypothetical protein
MADRALKELMRRYTVTEEKSRLTLTEKSGGMKLFLQSLDDLHQWDFSQNQKMVDENERLRALLRKVYELQESWKVRALTAEAELLEVAVKNRNHRGRQNVSELRYASLKRYLAKRLHPDNAPGRGIEKVVRNEIFKEIWNEIERLDQGFAAARSSWAA